MSQTVLPQLQTVEAELASQVSELEAQLASVREKLTGIRAVMPMFENTTSNTAEAVATEAPSTEAPVAEEPDDTEEAAAPDEPEITEKKATKSKKPAAKKAPATKKASSKKKVDGRAASWQKYTRPGVKNESIPDAVRLILETQPENDFKIADVMSALFKDDMPKSQYLKARNRISNVLSGGVRAGDWYKGERGTYRMTAA
ncbi:MAG: hypothetical protein HLUCCA11_17090 [Phormidesmis priestleyi Ana]|uniref:Uncharacterized protein n=1 Tax=Phormidesmis priestleyi Ana TaxID=1666911 RepID=A0A0P7ZGW1_9CYAN|nr:MAG: hypothetical protein HLUCCA11_17090 [Phormidesmis priestleyi Ana]